MQLGLAGNGGAVGGRLSGWVGGLFSGSGENGGGGVEARGGGVEGGEGKDGPWPRERESGHCKELGSGLVRGLGREGGGIGEVVLTEDSVAEGAGAGGERRALE